jgi:hypothetical protein
MHVLDSTILPSSTVNLTPWQRSYVTSDILLPILQHIYHVDPVPQPIRTPDHRSGRVTCAEPARASTSGALPLKDQN